MHKCHKWYAPVFRYINDIILKRTVTFNVFNYNNKTDMSLVGSIFVR
jgi:hypothetical protein